MRSRWMTGLDRFTMAGLLLTAAAILPAAAAHAQRTPAAHDIPYSRFDVYAGYAYFHPINSGIGGYQYQDLYRPNVTASVSGYFNRYVGLQLEGGYFNDTANVLVINPCPTGSNTNQCYTQDEKMYTAEAGPVVRWPLGNFVPFIHALGGGAKVNGPAFQPLKWGWAVTGGAGVDYVLPFLNHRIAIRPIQADFHYSQVVYGPLITPARTHGGFGEIDALKLSGGIVARFDEVGEKQSVMLGCTTEPSTVFPGDPVQVTGSTLYLNPRRRAVYTWSTNGGKITSAGQSATVDTSGMAPGDYTVLGRVENGNKASQQASCTAPFTIKAIEPPTMTCSANPSSVPSGTPVDINTVATSPQNRPLTYSYAASAGTVTGNGATARLNTDGLSPSTVTINCNVVDDKGHTASATTQVTIQSPSVPVIPQTQTLCTVGFTRDAKRPVRVDNEAKGCLDDIALTLNQQTDAKLVVIGNASPDEKPEAAAERTLNIRQYLTQEKGVDPARIELRVGDTSGRTARDILVPNGATFSDAGTQSFDEKAIVRHGQAYGTGHNAGNGAAPAVRRRRRRRAAAPVATGAGVQVEPAGGV